MNKFKFYFILFSSLLVLFSCKDEEEDIQIEPLRDFQDQFTTDINNIILYLSTHRLNPNISDYANNANNPNLIIKKTEDTQPSLLSLEPNTTFPKLLFKLVKKHDITYKVYYLQFQEGSASEKPCPFDEVLVTYRGTSLKKETETQNSGQVEVVNATEFEDSPFAEKFTLSSVVTGWQEIFPLFGIGSFDEVATGNGPNIYTNYGAGIMFLPSGLGYYNGTRTNIPSYSPLVFSFQLQNLKRVDNDNDGIMTIDELATNNDGEYADTDADGVRDFGDFDDDNDGFPTRNEIKKVDGTLYLFSEIPGCDGLATDPNRIKKHLIKCL